MRLVTVEDVKVGDILAKDVLLEDYTILLGKGAFSDGKLSLSAEVGGDLPLLVGTDLVQETIDYTDKIYLEFGADDHIEGVSNYEEVKEIRKRAIKAGLKLVDCPIRHLGTEKAQSLYLAIEKHLQEKGVEISANGSYPIARASFDATLKFIAQKPKK